jgi:hypothetical protein
MALLINLLHSLDVYACNYELSWSYFTSENVAERKDLRKIFINPYYIFNYHSRQGHVSTQTEFLVSLITFSKSVISFNRLEEIISIKRETEGWKSESRKTRSDD